MDFKKFLIKLTSRKFWLAVASFITAILVYKNVDAAEIEKITAIIMSGGVLMAYILAEGFIDAKHDDKLDK